VTDLAEVERLKYEHVWTYSGYREQADGAPLVQLAYTMMGCQPPETLIDWGCGRGTPAQQFQDLGLQVQGVDIAHNCLNPGVTVPLHVACLWDDDLPDWLYARYAFCTDVLEHIPQEHLPATLRNIRIRTLKAAFIQVCTEPDIWGAKLNPPQPLHLTVRPKEWWQTVLEGFWGKVAINSAGRSRCCFYCEV
jgi:hypothetical protein